MLERRLAQRIYTRELMSRLRVHWLLCEKYSLMRYMRSWKHLEMLLLCYGDSVSV